MEVEVDASKTDVYFRGHACVQINSGDTTLVCDPWFSGKVFNSSWAPLRNITFEFSSLRKNVFIWISHEHPDHFHIPTLKMMREKILGDVYVLYKEQPNPNVENAIKALGFQFKALPKAAEISISENFKVVSYPEGTDCGLVIRTADRVIFNQNDCIYSQKRLREIKNKIGNLDLWLFQFSLAGYYANDDDKARLDRAHNRHLEQIEECFEILRPKIFMPFASFMYFCKEKNKYLNAYRVKLSDLLEQKFSQSYQILWYDNQLVWSSNWTERNEKNIILWESAWSELLISEKTSSASELLPSGVSAFYHQLESVPKILRPGKTSIFLTDSNRYINLDMWNLRYDVSDRPKYLLASEVPDEEFIFFLKFEWGADTLNITGCLKILNQFRWRHISYLKHALYVHKEKGALLSALIAFIGASLRWLQFRTGKI